VRRVWFSPRSVGLHLLLLALTPTFILLFLWQVRRATSGNTLSWAYVFEWPFFLAYALYMWWRLVHEPTAERPDPGVPGAPPLPGGDEVEDEELAAYNRYLAELDASGHRKRW